MAWKDEFVPVAFGFIKEYCREHKGKDKVHCWDNECELCVSEQTEFGCQYYCKLKDMTW